MTRIEEGPSVLRSPKDMAVRANIMWAATIALNGLIGAGVSGDWTSYMIGHELTARDGIDHGRTLTIILPAVMKQRRQQKREKLLQYAERVLGITEGDDDQRLDTAIERTVIFDKQMGLPTSLADVDLDSQAIDPLIANLEKHDRLNLGEHGDIHLEQSRLILQAAL